MSRIGRRPIELPQGVQVSVDAANQVRVKGPKGELTRRVHPSVRLNVGETLDVSIEDPEDRRQRAHWGTASSLVRSMVEGVSRGFERRLEINGVGYRAELKGKQIHLNLGHSHPVSFSLPEGVTAELPQPTQVILRGSDKQVLGQAAAQIRSFRPVEPYKGKGVMYAGEHVRRKEGKKAGK